MVNKQKQELLDRLQRMFVSPIISTKGLVKVKKLYKEIAKSDRVTVEMINSVRNFERNRF